MGANDYDDDDDFRPQKWFSPLILAIINDDVVAVQYIDIVCDTQSIVCIYITHITSHLV